MDSGAIFDARNNCLSNVPLLAKLTLEHIHRSEIHVEQSDFQEGKSVTWLEGRGDM